ncbi:MAG: hypothetical protein LBK66_12050 [Spirochaetaceae bacterium]|jgi:hypothetical protein|nr:hypothetical protein [Spirochaetaceae bacterium]
MLKDLTVKFEEDVYEAMLLTAGDEPLNDFIAERVWQQSEYAPMEAVYEGRRRRVDEAIRGRRSVAPGKREEATHKLFGLLGYTDGHEVDRFLERCHSDKEQELSKEAGGRRTKWQKN